MKTSKQLESNFAETSINIRLDHKVFVVHTAKKSSVKTRKILRSIDKGNQQIFAVLGIEDCVAQSKVSIHPEFVAFAFHLYGLSRKLFLYLTFFELDNNTCTFKIKAETIQRFLDFCSLFREEERRSSDVLQAARALMRKNIMIALDEESYMLNPLIAGGSNVRQRRKLIDNYSELLEKKGLDASLHFYPKYQVIK
jgi:hypothetical protein